MPCILFALKTFIRAFFCKKCSYAHKLGSYKIRKIPSTVDFHSLYQLLHSQVYGNGLKLWNSSGKICTDKWKENQTESCQCLLVKLKNDTKKLHGLI